MVPALIAKVARDAVRKVTNSIIVIVTDIFIITAIWRLIAGLL